MTDERRPGLEAIAAGRRLDQLLREPRFDELEFMVRDAEGRTFWLPLRELLDELGEAG